MELEDYSPYSDKDLRDLLQIHEQTLSHYEMMLKKDLKDGDRLSVELLMKYLLADMEELKKEIQKRTDKKN